MCLFIHAHKICLMCPLYLAHGGCLFYLAVFERTDSRRQTGPKHRKLCRKLQFSQIHLEIKARTGRNNHRETAEFRNKPKIFSENHTKPLIGTDRAKTQRHCRENCRFPQVQPLIYVEVRVFSRHNKLQKTTDFCKAEDFCWKLHIGVRPLAKLLKMPGWV